MRRPVARGLLALALTGVLVLGLAVGLTTPLLFLAPCLLVLAPLLAGRYLGERSLLRLARAVRRRPSRRRPATARARRRPAARALARGGGLIACSLAVRPPPVPA
jgi:hypothetical protein